MSKQAQATLIQPATNISKHMQQVMLALIPGIAATSLIFGYAILLNILIAIVSALLMEAAVLKMRGKAIAQRLTDGSAILTAILLALSLSPLVPYWVIVIGIFFAIVVAKQLYGGLGHNLFNPAMAAYAVLMISFPLQMTLWPNLDISSSSSLLNHLHSILQWSFFQQLPSNILSIDAITAATPLDEVRTASRALQNKVNTAIIFQSNNEHTADLTIAISYLIGGIYLVFKRIAAWQLAFSFLLSFSLLTTLYWLTNPGNLSTPLFHLIQGSTIFTAFFIITDPVTAPQTPQGRLLAGILVAILVFVIRNWGGYPEGAAFAILLMNLSVPLIDRYMNKRPT
jgi:electron transport complex protein RnfD